MQTEENIYADSVPLPDGTILESFKKFIEKDAMHNQSAYKK